MVTESPGILCGIIDPLVSGDILEFWIGGKLEKMDREKRGAGGVE